MFEGKPPRVTERPVPNPAEDECLRPLLWSDLASRLAAARDLRASLMEGVSDCVASFDPGSARWIAAHGTGEDLVNPEDSVNRKGAARSDGHAPLASRGGAARD